MSHSSSSRLSSAGLAWAFASAFFGATVGIADKWLLGYHAGPLPVVALRASMAAVILGLGLLLFGRSHFRLAWRDVPFFLLFGLVGVAAVYLGYILAVLGLGAALATALFYVYPTIATLLAAAFLGERLTWRRSVPLPLTFAGCVFASGLLGAGPLQANLAGVGWALASAAAFALYPLLARRALSRYSPWTSLFYSLFFGALLLDLFWLVLSLVAPTAGGLGGTLPPLGRHTLSFWGGMLYLALGATIGLYLCDLQAIHRLPVRIVGLIGTLEPILTGILAFLLFGERLTPLQLLGAGLVLSGVVWLRVEGGNEAGGNSPIRVQKS